MSRFSAVSALAGLIMCHITTAGAAGERSGSAPAANQWPPQVQVAVRVPFEPSIFQSADRQCLIYELYLTNFEEHSVRVDRADAIDAAKTAQEPIASFAAPALNTMIHHVGQQIVGDEIASAEDDSQRDIGAGQSAIVFLFVQSSEHSQLPARLTHRLLIGDSVVETDPISTHHEKVLTVGAPLEGGPWVAGSGPSNESHHRRQLLLLDGTPHLSSRFAIDWMRLKSPQTSSGDEQDNRSYSSYDQPVLAVTDATVEAIRDGIAENVPGHFGTGKLAVVMSYDTIYGNMIILNLGAGQYAYYGHLKPGSIAVKKGDRVRGGQVIGRIGNSGSSFEPHLHFEITTADSAFRGEGIPYAIDHYTVTGKDGPTDRRRGELPLDGTVVTFRD